MNIILLVFFLFLLNAIPLNCDYIKSSLNTYSEWNEVNLNQMQKSNEQHNSEMEEHYKI